MEKHPNMDQQRPNADAVMEKGKSRISNDHSVRSMKIRKISQPANCSQNRNYQNPNVRKSQPRLSRESNLSQTIDPTTGDNLDQLTEIWYHASQNQQISTEDQVELTKMNDQLARAELKIQNLHQSLQKAWQNNEEMANFIEGEVSKRDEIIEKLKVSSNLMSVTRDNTNVLTETFERCEESREHFLELYNNVTVKQQAKIQTLTELCNEQIIKEKEELKDRLELKSKEFTTVQDMCEQLETETVEKNQLIIELIGKQKECEILIVRNEEKYNKEVEKVKKAVKDIEATLIAEQEVKHNLVTENNKTSKIFEELLSEYQVLQATSSEYKKRVECLKSDFLELKEREERLSAEIDEEKSVHLLTISNKDLELADIRRQIQDLTLKLEQANTKLSEIISNNEELSKDIMQGVEDIDQFKTELFDKENEIGKINADSSNALEKNKELSANIQNMNAELITQEKQLYRDKEDFEKYRSQEDRKSEMEKNMRRELDITEQKLRDKRDDIDKLLKASEDEKLKFSKQTKKFIQDIGQKDHQIIVLQEATEKLEQEIKANELQYTNKIQATHMSKHCQSMEHEKRIKEQNIKIGSLNKELSAIKLKLKRMNLGKNETGIKQRAKHEAQLKEITANYKDLKEKFVVVEHENKDLKSKLQTAQFARQVDDTTERHVQNLSPVDEISDAKYELTAATTPKPILKSIIRDSPLKVQKVHFDFESSANLGHIDGLKMFEEAERRYVESTGPNKPDWAKLCLPQALQELENSPVVTTAPQTGSRKFFKRSTKED